MKYNKNKNPARILIIDDSELNHDFLDSIFAGDEYIIYNAINGEEGLNLAIKELPELIFLDVMMPIMDGYTTAKKIQEHPDIKHIPIIFITALDSLQDKLKAFDNGAVDFVTKPFNHKEIMARAEAQLNLIRTKTENEQILRIAMDEKREASLARVAGGISHNFNNMLAATLGNIMLIELSKKDIIENHLSSIEDIKTGLTRMQAMVKQFLHLADRSGELAQGNPNILKTKIHQTINLVIENLDAKLKTKNLNIIEACDNCVDEDIMALCDPNFLHEIFFIIFDEVFEVSLGKSTIKIYSKIKKKKVVLILEIINFNVSEDIIDSIFEPFALPFANVGVGLAFSVAKRLIIQNNGSIIAEHNGNNLHFNITFPIE